ncbi:MAG: hypothetical protein ACI91Z_001088 [Yoonia sp.]|jgi:hypothetical protein
MATKPTSSSKTVKLATIAPDPVITPLAGTTASKAGGATSAVIVPKAEMIKKPEFIDRAVDRTDVKKRDAKPAIEAALAVLSEALIKGEELNLPPLGKLRIVKTKDVGDGAKVLTLKLRTMKDGAGLGASPSDNDDDD